MVRVSRPRFVVSSLLSLAAVVGLSVVSITPVQAATNATLGVLTPASPASNKYAGCVAAVLTGSGVTFGSAAAMSADLAAIWPVLPTPVTDTCKQAVDGNQPQVCVNPTGPVSCPAIGAPAAASATDVAAGNPGDWKVVTDGVGTGAYAQAAFPTSGAGANTANVTGTFTTPVYVCTTKDCGSLPTTGLFTDCGPTTCGPVTSMTVSVIGRTPNGENAVYGNLHVVDGYGNAYDQPGFFGDNGWTGTGCAATECVFAPRFTWTCKASLNGAQANCGGQSLTATFTFISGAYPGGCACASPAPAVGVISEIQLTANNLNYAQNPTICAAALDCLRADDARLTYLDGKVLPTVVLNPAAAPSAVITLASSDIGCLVGIDIRKVSAISCLDVTGAFAPLLQIAHAPIVPAVPPTIAAGASPSGGWQRTPVTVSLTASADPTRFVQSITYSATGAQATATTVVAGPGVNVLVGADGATSLSFFATDSAGVQSSAGTIDVQVDRTAPAITCAAPSTWSSTNLTVACTASDSLSGLATPTQVSLSLVTSVPAGTETAAAATNSIAVCDVAGNCATAGPVTGLKVDQQGPSISVAAPTGTYTVGQVVKASYTCTDGGSGVATCTGTLANGAAIDTSTAGSHTFTVDATDAVGNHSQMVGSYAVTASIPTPTPAPTPTCNEKETGDNVGDHRNDCGKHDVEVRPIATPKPTAKPTPKPTPTPTRKPAEHGSDKGSGDQSSH